jgi:hypothetical protein
MPSIFLTMKMIPDVMDSQLSMSYIIVEDVQLQYFMKKMEHFDYLVEYLKIVMMVGIDNK